MKYKVFFILLIVISNLLAAEQPEENKNESSINQEDKSKSNTDAESADKEDKIPSLMSELKESTDQDSINVVEVPSSNKNIQTNLQPDQETNIKDTELSTGQLLEEEQPEEKRVTKDSSKESQTIPVNKEDEESEKWTKLNKEITKKWDHKSKSIYKRQYDSLNEHLPTTIFTDDYSKQFFYCIKKGNLTCLRGVINKLEKIGLTIQEILRFKNKLGDTPLIYAVKQGQIDTVRFLLLQSADPRAVNNSFKSPIDIAIEKKQIDIINAIAEMMPYLLEDKEINNEENSDMYNFAIKTKENTCNAKDN
ncbi:ankyrin repeat domain-containing protein [Wolbachia endosymbiont of Armadillidium arcangelii]|uniref:Ankyrin repeat domain-containing protein n=1 Tax=Wolbachia endosymbiont of Armadillidium arcangelii TaxID=3158571 RepID=A0AAU7Q2D3_9RICK